MPYNHNTLINYTASSIIVDEDALDINYEAQYAKFDYQPIKLAHTYDQLVKVSLDIETSGLDSTEDRIYMIGLSIRCGDKKEFICFTDKDESVILANFWAYINTTPINLITGHYLFSFDLPFIHYRSRVHGIYSPLAFSCKPEIITSSSHNGKPIQYNRIVLPGVDIIDTFHQCAIWDKTANCLESYRLKDAVISLGLRSDRRLELSVNAINKYWHQGDHIKISEYLFYDLEDTDLLTDTFVPPIYYQLCYVPDLSLQSMAVASPALKAQKIYASFRGSYPIPDEKLAYKGASVSCKNPGIYDNIGKIDVSSLYPSIMLKYGICSRKDTSKQFLSVLRYMLSQRLILKAKGKSGDVTSEHQSLALKILINGAYGFLGVGNYSFNDMQGAALITAYGRKILKFMETELEKLGCILISSDTDGVYYSPRDDTLSHSEIFDTIQSKLPNGIVIDLEYSGIDGFFPKPKSYVLFTKKGVVSKGLYKSRNRYKLEKSFPVDFLLKVFSEGLESAVDYYSNLRAKIIDHTLPVDLLLYNRRIGKAEKTIRQFNFLPNEDGKVTFYYTKPEEIKARSLKQSTFFEKNRIPTQTDLYWGEYYAWRLDQQFIEILGEIPNV
jgi:DNA polymerase, archaea type